MALDEKGRMLHGRLDFFERNVTQLTKHMSTIVGHHKDGVNQGMKFSAQVKNVAAQEPFADLQDRLVALSEITQRIALERRSIMCDRAETQVLQKLADIKNRVIGPTKALLRDRDNCVKSLFKAKRKMEDDTAKGLMYEKTMGMLEHRHQLKNTETTVDNNMELFEVQRVEDIKNMREDIESVNKKLRYT